MLLSALAAVAGCQRPFMTSDSPVKPAGMSPGSVALDVFFVRFPFGDREANETLWQEVDEQHFPAELRRKLAENGFRVGLIGGQPPMALSKLMDLKDKPMPTGEAAQVDLAEADDVPRVIRRHLQTRAGRRSEIVASPEYEQMPVLLRESGRLAGQTFAHAQARLAVKTLPQPDGHVLLELVPELQHDQARQRWIGDNQGMLRLKADRPCRAFDEMKISAKLAPGSMLLLSSLTTRPASLGHRFFTENDGQLEQKLLVIRLVQTQHDSVFSPPDVLQLDE
ncbi:MAG: hypothetical protein HQ567_05375 [Candidatus Nealsonbacteria bacterium]|nr:hypothetical protein [Candidatus Nealsonbacteria bacterium]